MDAKLILVVVGVLAATFEHSEALTCYSCDSLTNSKCLDPFKADGVGTCEGLTCAKSWGKASDTTVVIRTCIPTSVAKDECAEVTESGAKGIGCVCRTNYCNDGQKVKPTLYNVFIGVAMATAMSIAWMGQI